jgi:diacylglycerol kinase (ATP)
MPVRLLLNPRAGRGRARHLAARLAGQAGVEVATARCAAEMTERAAAAAAAGDERVLVAGGDGTLHHAIQGLAGTRCAVGVLPLGSGNDLARALGLPLDPERAFHRALCAAPRRIDLGRAGERVFVGVACAGIDSEVAVRAGKLARPFRGRWLYPCVLARALCTFSAPAARVTSDAGDWQGSALLVAIANAPCYGGGMRIAPAARLDDGWLDLVLVGRLSRLRLLLLFPRVYRGRHVTHPAVRALRVRRAALRLDRPVPVVADGEPLGLQATRRIEVEVLPGALWVAA